MNCSELGSLKFRTGLKRTSKRFPRNFAALCPLGRIRQEIPQRLLKETCTERIKTARLGGRNWPASRNSRRPHPEPTERPDRPHSRLGKTLRLRFLGNYWFKPPNSRARKATPRIMGEPKKKDGALRQPSFAGLNSRPWKTSRKKFLASMACPKTPGRSHPAALSVGRTRSNSLTGIRPKHCLGMGSNGTLE